MNASAPKSYFSRTASQLLERLEGRQLLSGSWTTIEDYGPTGATFLDIATDSAGNLYVAGTEGGHPIVRQKLAGSSSWSTIYYSPDAAGRLSELAVNPAGDVYVAGYKASGAVTVLRRGAGQSTFTTVDTGPVGMITDLAIDSAGDVFTVGSIDVTTIKGKKSTTLQYWAVRKQTAGQGTFATVDQYLYSAGAGSLAYGVSIVESGPSAGVYVVGQGTSTTQPTAALVRKSTNGGSSWTTIDTFRYQGVNSSTGEAIAADAAGNIYVTGTSSKFLLTRKSTNGGSFAIVDSMPFPDNSLWPYAMATDHSNSVYVVGLKTEAGANHPIHAFTRSNVGGTWSTVDDFFESGGAFFGGVTVDPTGDVFVAGMNNARGIVRSNAQPAARAFATQTPIPDGLSPHARARSDFLSGIVSPCDVEFSEQPC